MPAKLDHRHARKNLLSLAVEEPPPPLPVLTVQPLLVLTRQIHGTIKLPRPLQMGAVKVRMRDCNRGEPTVRLYEGDGVLVEEADAVPQDVAGGRLDEDCALADGELRPGEDGPYSRVGVVLLDFVGVGLLHLG